MRTPLKYVAPESVGAWRRKLPDKAAAVAVVAGNFYILQPANLSALRSAGRRARRVFVLLESDTDVRRRGLKRPGGDAARRVCCVSALKDVSALTVVSAARAGGVLRDLSPFTLVRCSRAGADALTEKALAAAAATEETPWIKGCSTSDILEAVRSGRTPVTAPENFSVRRRPDRAAKGGRVVTVNGCFDVLHAGHIGMLAAARAMGDSLTVLINDDGSVRRYKGPTRPVMPLVFRREALMALSSVSGVRSFREDDPLRLLAAVKPAIHVKGGTYEPDRVAAERNLLKRWGGRLRYCPMIGAHSTTRYLRQVIRAMKGGMASRRPGRPTAPLSGRT